MQDFTETQAKRAVDRARGMAAEVRSHVTEDDVALDDDRIGERIRSQLGRLVSHPGAIEVNVVNGYVRLSGHILAAEHDGLLAALRQMPEVKDIDDHLQVHQEAGDIPELQG